MKDCTRGNLPTVLTRSRAIAKNPYFARQIALTGPRRALSSAVRILFDGGKQDSRLISYRAAPFEAPGGTPIARCESLGESPGDSLCDATQDGTAGMSGGKIRIRLEAYDHQALDASSREIVDHAKRTGARVAGPIPLPTRREIYTVNRSTFIDKKSREQFEIRTHKRIIDITEPNARTVEALNRLVVPAGVFVKIKA